MSERVGARGWRSAPRVRGWAEELAAWLTRWHADPHGQHARSVRVNPQTRYGWALGQAYACYVELHEDPEAERAHRWRAWTSIGLAGGRRTVSVEYSAFTPGGAVRGVRARLVRELFDVGPQKTRA